MLETVDLKTILARHPARPESLLQVLREVQAAHNHIPPGVDAEIAEALQVPLARVRGVAGFYSFLSLEPLGRYRVLFSDNITDRMLGSRELMQALCGKLWLEPGKMSEDGLVSVDATSCTGMCDQGPALLVNGRAVTRLTHQRINEIGELIRAQTPVADWPAEFFRVDDNIRRRDILLESARMTGAALTAAIERGPEAVIAELETSGLRGRGGAGFPTARKWAACRAASGVERYVVCNADEGEPGTFKDRVLLTSYADLVFEGMTVTALAVGARQGFLYLRGEYRHLLEPLEDTLRQRRAAGLLGKDILGQAGFDFDIAVHLGAGAYICGEESALIESLEGKRGVPRNRPPFPVTHGYRQRPTVVDNVETLCAAALVAMRGGDWYRAIGTAKSTGTKLLSVSGDCARPGIYEYPFGVTVRQVLADCGASDALAVQISGPSGVCIADSEFDRKIAFEDLATAGAFMVFDSSRDMFEVARNFVHFFAHESCGFCTPCRVGTSMQREIMDKIAHGQGTKYDLEQLAQLDRVLQAASHCGLGHGACNPVLDTLKRFRPAYERRLKSLNFRPAFDLDGALAEARRMTGRDDAGAHIGAET
ncbi:MAG: NADP oxidoreductase [Thiobacillus sp.]|nr:NADP oxidoreductase [Thiobacillus sp.]